MSVETVLREHGLSNLPAEYDSSIHSWRCAYPDRYGPCACFEELVNDLAALLRAARADALAPILALADQWAGSPGKIDRQWAAELVRGRTARAAAGVGTDQETS